MIADSQAIVYRTIQQFEPSIVYGCTFAHGRSFELGEFPTETNCGPGACGVINRETLAGTSVAYEYFFDSGEGEKEQRFFIIVRNLRNGRLLHKTPTGIPYPSDPLVVGNGPAISIVLKSDGSVSWITADSIGETTTYYEVHALDKTGNRLLATGTDIDPHSLALAGSTLYWTQAGQPHSVHLI